MQKLTPCLWFDRDVEEALNFYVSLLPDSRILQVTRLGGGGPQAGADGQAGPGDAARGAPWGLK
jgi:predicted 3-demethylubiquinone-9 3-methyltransferase (glyoxalase superfamily)